jgi:hypothetical protein
MAKSGAARSGPYPQRNENDWQRHDDATTGEIGWVAASRRSPNYTN